MTTSHDHIRELQAELRHCRLTRRERTAAETELAQAIAHQAELDCAFDELFDTRPRRRRTAVDRHPPS
ncbi:hypothetical protein [Inquilinus limosus]|uniref:Uncharacterized protein n=1 Tax=Inquilinus limosus TaxID=171674 RepID=A0A211ZHG5_9PROT|nr:hypothetical protein [Inquilinus limosus]OWJ64624.1 hypothetical protein BWR60_23680 [Inquilinus limosus]